MAMCQAWWPQSGTGAWGPWGVGPGYPTLSETWAQPPTCSDGNPQRWEPKHRRFFRPASHGPPGSKCATYDCVALHGYTISSGDWPACPPQGRWPHSCGMGVGHGTECTPPMERVTLKVGVAGALSTSACSHCRVNTSNAKHCRYRRYIFKQSFGTSRWHLIRSSNSNRLVLVGSTDEQFGCASPWHPPPATLADLAIEYL